MNSPRRVLLASLAGTTIEFFDFYIYATAAVLVFPKLFFPSADPTASVFQSFATFALAFIARPVGAVLFGHFGDRLGRKATLVAALLTMGLSTVAIGLLPTYATIGAIAPILLACCRLGQGLGLGGEWGGAVLLATENAPPGKRAWYGMFPQLGAPIGFLFSGGIFFALSHWLTDAQFLAFGWRLPFIASSLLVFVGLWVRLKITETPAFREAQALRGRDEVPIREVLVKHASPLALGVMIALATFLLFYLLTVFFLNYGTKNLGFGRETMLLVEMFGMLFFAAGIPLSAVWAERFGRRRTLLLVSLAILGFGLGLGPMYQHGLAGVTLSMVVGFFLMGITYGPLGTMLSELYPTAVRYTGSSLSFNLAGIFGASFAPNVATWLATHSGLQAVGWYLSSAAAISLLGLLLTRETRDAAYA